MPVKEIFLDIPTPCDQPWEEMQPAAGGRHCMACSKTVFDFSSYTDAELVAFFSQRSQSGICCRFRDDQVRRTITAASGPSVWRGHWHKALTLLLSLQVLATDSFAQKIKKSGHSLAASRPKAASKLMKGQVIEFSGGAAPAGLGILIRFAGNDSIRVRTDSAGHFTLPLPERFKTGTISWDEQETGGGTILAGSLAFQASAELPVLQLTWQVPEVLQAVQVAVPYSGRYFQGLPPHPAYREIRKPSFFKRMTGLFHKKKR